ncbi:hypothetical protein Val02_30930 [Virgisporangium aliadipatigenens]|uniref:Uncharacterized protein n=1 Tax=Virgisporangium aliadipatigenens TaxID=741659 RepID=A0A8J3YKX8_9ACTN|nr:hypothetical protein [Virgisporangium aliadipatigenens]GIJ46207.1 hypothetical protein Val02_30930 [Virgisporangium aliadipatigenens]
MVPALVRKTWRDDRRSVLRWAAGVAVFTSTYAGFDSQFQGAAELSARARWRPARSRGADRHLHGECDQVTTAAGVVLFDRRDVGV